MTLTFRIPPRVIAAVLAVIALVLAAVSFALEAYEWSMGVNNTYWVLELSDLFNVAFENNIPTWYNTLLLLAAAALSAFIAACVIQNQKRWQIHWIAFSVLFFYLSLDEAAAVHEIFTGPMREMFNTTGYLYFAWMLVGIPAVIIVGLLFLPFVWHLPVHTRRALISAVIVYILGTVVVEAIAANLWYQTNKMVTPRYTAVSGVEEFLEMLGVILVIYALLTYIVRHIGTVTLQFDGD